MQQNSMVFISAVKNKESLNEDYDKNFSGRKTKRKSDEAVK